MKDFGLGFVAIFIFVLLLLFFLAATASVPSGVVAPAAVATSPALQISAPVENNLLVAPSSAPPVNTAVSQVGGTTYVVQPGDWLSSIARQYSTTVPAILAANPQITDPDNVSPGQSILIP